MTKYIDADALINQCEAIIRKAWNKKAAPASWSEAYNAFEDDIEEFPAADVVEVRHGEWLKHGIGTHQWFCSVCEGKESARRPFCPRCGAKMDAYRYGQEIKEA